METQKQALRHLTDCACRYHTGAKVVVGESGFELRFRRFYVYPGRWQRYIIQLGPDADAATVTLQHYFA